MSQERQYSTEIINWIETVEKIHLSNPSESKSICEKLISLGKTIEDDWLLGFSYYYLAEAAFIDNRDGFEANILLGIEYQLRIDQQELLAKSYNLLGIASSYSSSQSVAMDYYLVGLSYAKKGDWAYLEGVLNSNIASVYREIGDFRKAIEYLKLSLIKLEAAQLKINLERNIGFLYGNIAECYLRIGEYQKAKQWFDRRNPTYAKAHSEVFLTDTSFLINYYHCQQASDLRDIEINKFIATCETSSSLVSVFEEIFLLCELLKEIKAYDLLWRLLEVVNKKVLQDGFTRLSVLANSYKIYYYQFKADDEKLKETYLEYFQLNQRLEEETKKQMIKDILLREEIDTIRRTKQKIENSYGVLLEKSRRDYLTNLPNREWLEKYVEEKIEKAYQEKTALTLGIMDIDNFKIYNDTLGHQTGDLFLLALAELLQKLMEDKRVFCARYGGDEFVVILEGYTKEEVSQWAKKLRREVSRIDILVEKSGLNSKMTVSQGYNHFIPTEEQQQFKIQFNIADQALYAAKRKNKNQIFVAENH